MPIIQNVDLYGNLKLYESPVRAVYNDGTYGRTGQGMLEGRTFGTSPTCDFSMEVGGVSIAQPTGIYDAAALTDHFVAGDGRANENIALTSMHHLFHSEHNRLAVEVRKLCLFVFRTHVPCCCYTVVTLLSRCWYTVITQLLSYWHTAATLLLHCCHTVVTLLLQGGRNADYTRAS
jgi:hypothetical protein